MKCPQCDAQHRASAGMRCRCGYRFCFNPKSNKSLGITDGKFAAAISLASQNDTSYFTSNQLYAAYIKKFKLGGPSPIVQSVIMIVLGIGFTVTGLLAILGIPLVVIGVIRLLWNLVFPKPPKQSRQNFQLLIDQWLKAGKPIPKMITEPRLHQPPPNWSENDIYDYGAEKILVVQRDLLVDLFVLNNQHAEQRMLVVAESGYPNYIASRANELLQQRRDLPVYVIHDATLEGMSMVTRLRSPGHWLNLGDRKLIELGFSPEDFKTMKRTRDYDEHQVDRHLPVDALLWAPLVANMGYCFTHQIPMHELFQERQLRDDTGSYG